MANSMRLSFFGAAGTVTGSSYLLNTGVGKLMVDCGMFQGPQEIEQRNYLGFGFEPSDIDFLILTHAHIDHIGLLPRLVKFGFKGSIYYTNATRDLAEILLLDSAHIQARDAEYSRKRNVDRERVQSHALYASEDVVSAMRRFKGVDYEEPVELSRNIAVRFRDAGHILGSASVEITVKTAEGGATVVASGDIGQKGTAILKDPMVFDAADYVLMETTYGDRNHDDISKRKEMLKTEIDRMLDKGGPLIIPSFAVGRTQQLLYHIAELKAENRHWGFFPIVVDSPLASKATAIVEAHPECFDRETAKLLSSGRNPFHADGLRFTESVDDSKSLNFMKGPRMIISASGMCSAGRIRHHLANHLPDHNATVLFVGFQAQGTLGRILLQNAKDVKMFGERVPVNARVAQLDGFSAHADRSGLFDWLRSMKEHPQTVYLVHGEPEASESFKELIETENYYAHIAQEDETVSLPLTRPVGALDTRIPIAYRRADREPAAERDLIPATADDYEKVHEVIPRVDSGKSGLDRMVADAGGKRADAIGYTLPIPMHPGDSVQNRVTRYLRWLDKEISDASFIVDEINAELPNWVNAPTLPLTPAQSTAVIYDDVISIVLPLLDRILASYEKQVVIQSKSGEKSARDYTGGDAGDIATGKSTPELESALVGIHDLRERIAALLTEKRGEFLSKLDEN